MLVKKATKQMMEKVLVGASMALIALALAAPASATSNRHRNIPQFRASWL
jgi:hypothetical protein